MKRWVYLLIVLAGFAAGGWSAAAEGPQTLSSVRKIYIEKMDNGLDQYLGAAISKKFHGTVQVVLNQSEADAIMRGVNTAAQNTTESTVQLVDRGAQVVLWSGTAGDRNRMTLAVKHGGRQQIADNLVGQLKKAMQP